MSDIPPEKVEIETRSEDTDCEKIGINELEGLSLESQFVLNRNVLMEFKKLGSRDDLHHLRQLSEEYYESLNPVLWDTVAKSIKFDISACKKYFEYPAPAVYSAISEFKTGDEEEAEKGEDKDMNDGQLDEIVDENIVGQEVNEMAVNIDEDAREDQLDEVDNEDLEVDPEEEDALDEVDDEDQEVTFSDPSGYNVTFTARASNGYILQHNLTPKIAHIFRKLDLHEVWIGKLKREQMSSYEMITDLTPYITSLRLNALPLDSKYKRRSYSQFLNGFTSLKSLEIDYNVGHSNFYTPNRMSIKQLEIVIANLRSNPKIKFYTNSGYEDLLIPFATRENTSFNFYFSIAEDETPLPEFGRFVEQFGYLKNIIYELEFYQGFPSLHQMNFFTAIIIPLANQIEYLLINYDFDFDETNFEMEDELGVRRCIDQMSPFVTEMFIYVRSKPGWNILSRDMDWPKLTFLEITGYKQPLEILKKCPSLEKLFFRSDQDLCIFSNTQQSDKENLNEYFGNLHRLNELRIGKEQDDQKLANGNELDGYLKELLPQLQEVIYYNFS